MGNDRLSLNSMPRLLWMGLALGLLIRAPFWPMTGFAQDFHDFAVWAAYGASHGVVSIYDDPQSALSNGFVNYPPVYLYILAALGRVHQLFGAESLHGISFLISMKILTALFEAAAALLLYRFAASRWGEGAGLWAFALYFLNPALIYLGAYYGQVDAVFGFFLLASALALLDGRPLWGGCFAALSMWTKIQTLPFLPFLALIPVIQGKPAQSIRFIAGFAFASLAVLSPIIATGRMPLMLERCVAFNFDLSPRLSNGAFNLWRFHPDPLTHDQRLLGWLAGGNGMADASGFMGLLTFRNLGTALFGAGWLAALAFAWRAKHDRAILIALAAVGLLFFLCPTRSRERYVFTFFLLFAAPAALHGYSRWLYGAFSVLFLWNLASICPLWGPIPALIELNPNMAQLCAGLYVIVTGAWVSIEWRGVDESRTLWLRALRGGAVGLTLVAALAGLNENIHRSDGIVYLSELTPAASTQDWPPLPPEVVDPPPGYRLGRDLSVDETPLRIAGIEYRYGLGTHANARIVYDIPAGFRIFEAWVGVDDAAMAMLKANPAIGKVEFEARLNGEPVYLSPSLVSGMPAQHVAIRLNPESGARLELLAHDGGDGIDGDHADWALARLRR